MASPCLTHGVALAAGRGKRIGSNTDSQRRMRLLWVKAGRILPTDTGGKIRSFHLARQLAKRHQVTFLSYYDGPPDRDYEQRVDESFPGAVLLRTGFPLNGVFAKALHFAARLPNRAPYSVSKFYCPAVGEFISRSAREDRFDVMICDFLAASLNFAQPLGAPTVLFQHNVESALWGRRARHETNPLRRAVATLEAAKMSRYERATVGQFHHVVAVSENDRDLMSSMTSTDRITVVPTGVDLSEYRRARSTAKRAPLVLFLGSMDWEPNIDGVGWFVQQVWPQVLTAVPNARFRIVGRDPAARVRAWASPTIEVTGTVPSVIEHLRDTAVFVVPLRMGGGTRLKIYEAMAAGLALVSTAVGAEGLDYTDGHDLAIADDAEAFASRVIELLQDSNTRAAMGAAAVQTAERFDWANVVASFEGALEAAKAVARGHHV